MAEYSAVAAQTIQPGGFAIFDATTVPCELGLVQHSDGSPLFSLSGLNTNNSGCCCRRQRNAEYVLDFGGNIAIATGGTAGEISVAFYVGGVTDPASIMRVTPAAVEEYFNVSRSKTVPIFNNCCQSVAIQNTSDQAITLEAATLRILLSNPNPWTL